MPIIDIFSSSSGKDGNIDSPIGQRRKGTWKDIDYDTNPPMTDNSHSTNIVNGDVNINKLTSSGSDNYFSSIKHSVGIFDRSEIDLVNKRYRYGINTPSDSIHTVKEYLFFTKPDLCIYPYLKDLNVGLQNQVYWLELLDKNPEILYCLQDSLDRNGDHFNHLLENTVQSNLSIPGLSSEMVDTPTNLYGVGYQYHGSAEASDDSFDFSLEFRDVKGLPVYHFFRAYEDYQVLKHHGVLETKLQYILDKILYDQYSIYKFLVDEDGETIVYYAKLYGVKSKSLPRDVFENVQYDNGLSYTIDFNAAFFEDMRPNIIADFNDLSRLRYDNAKYNLGIYNGVLGRNDPRPATAAFVFEDKDTKKYKLRWKGDDQF